MTKTCFQTCHLINKKYKDDKKIQTDPESIPQVVKLTMFYISPPGEVADNLKMAYCFMTAYSSGGKKSVDSCQNVGLFTDVGWAMKAGPDSGGKRLKDSLMCVF